MVDSCVERRTTHGARNRKHAIILFSFMNRSLIPLLLLAAALPWPVEAQEGDNGAFVGQPAIFWHDRQWQTFQDGRWFPYRASARDFDVAESEAMAAPEPEPEIPQPNDFIPGYYSGFGFSNAGLHRRHEKIRHARVKRVQSGDAFGRPNVELGQRTIGIGRPNVAIGQTTIGLGQPNTGLGQTTIGIGQPNFGLGQPNFSIGPPNLALGKPTIGIGRRNTAIGQTTIGIGQPVIGLGRTTIGIGRPMVFTPQHTHASQQTSH
jgi:hypothetical protein